MKTIIRKYMLVIMIILAIVSGIALAVFALVNQSAAQDVGQCEFSRAQVIISFLAKEEFDSTGGPSLYYNVRKNKKVVIPMTYLGKCQDNMPFPMQKYTTRDGKLLAVTYNLSHAITNIVIYDIVSGESWPRLRDDEVSYTPEVVKKWQNRYARLKAEHPVLVDEKYFTR